MKKIVADAVAAASTGLSNLRSSLAAVAFSGSYNDLTDKPNIPSSVTIPDLSKGTTSGNGNAVTDLSVSGHTITLVKGKTFSENGHTHTESDITNLGSYLPLSGGNMTGLIHITSSNGVGFQHEHTNGTQLYYGVGSGGDNRGIYQGSGNNHYEGWLLVWDNTGKFVLATENAGARGKQLIGNPTGDLTWDNTAVSLNGHTHTESEITDLGSYLPLAGGNMTGVIRVTVNTPPFHSYHSNGTNIRFGMGSGGQNRGIYQGSGNSHYEGWLLTWDGNGAFTLRSENNGAAGRALTGDPTGNLTWGGTALSLDGHTHSQYLTEHQSLSSCAKIGSVNALTTNNWLYRSVGTSFLRMSGGASANTGANILLYGDSHASNAGRFYIYCNDGTTTKNLNGTIGGTLQWNGQTVSTSSDERLKTAFSPIPGDVLEAWGKVNWHRFKFKEDAERKGIENCRWHPGLVAQRVKAVFEEEGLDACEYGILCHDEWQDEFDDDGNLIRKAGDQWMIRYEEALAMEAAYQRRRADRLEEKLMDLETRIMALENGA